jgi:hypothetical protein
MYLEILSDPQTHNTAHHIYIAHAINDSHRITGSLLKRKIRGFRDPNSFYCASLVGRVEKEFFEKYRGTGPLQSEMDGTAGLALRLPTEDLIKVASVEDLGSPEDLAAYVKEHRNLATPLQLLGLSVGAEGSRDYNEMIIRGHPDTRVNGVLCTDYRKGRLLQDLVRKIGYEVPLIELPRKELGIRVLAGDFLRMM